MTRPTPPPISKPALFDTLDELDPYSLDPNDQSKYSTHVAQALHREVLGADWYKRLNADALYENDMMVNSEV